MALAAQLGSQVAQLGHIQLGSNASTGGGGTRTAPATVAVSQILSRHGPAIVALRGVASRSTLAAVSLTFLRRGAPARLSASLVSHRETNPAIALQANPARRTPATVALIAGTLVRQAPALAALSAIPIRRAPATVALSGTRRQTLPTIALIGSFARSVPAHVALTHGGIIRSAPAHVALSGVTLTRSAPATVALAGITVRRAPAAVALAAVSGPIVNYGNLSVQLDTSQVRTDVVTGSSSVLGSLTETFTGDGNTFFWVLQRAVSNNASNAQAPVVTVNGIGQALGAGGSSTSAPFLFVTYAPGISALMLGGAPVPAAGDTIVVSYPYDIPVAARVQDTAAIQAAISAGVPNRGHFSIGGTIGNAGLTLDAAVAQALAQVQAYADPFLKVDLLVPEQYMGQGIAEGQQITFRCHSLGITRTMAIVVAEWLGSKMPSGKQLHLTLEG